MWFLTDHIQQMLHLLEFLAGFHGIFIDRQILVMKLMLYGFFLGENQLPVLV